MKRISLNSVFWAIGGIISVGIVILTYWQIKGEMIGSAYEWTGAICAGVMSVGLIGAIGYAIKQEWKPEKLFLVLFIPLSFGMMMAMPLRASPDEDAHLMRIWQVSVGELFGDQGSFYQPVNLQSGMSEDDPKTLMQLITLPDKELDTSSYVQATSVGTNTGVYPVNNYFPQALGMFLMRLLTENRVLILYGARIGSLLFSTFLFYYAVKKIPIGKYSCITIALFPMVLQEAASASADGFTCAAAFAFIAFLLDIGINRKVLSKADIAMLFFLAFCVSTFKLMYFPLVFLIVTIPKECFKEYKHKKWTISSVLTISILSVIGWLLLCKLKYVDGAATSDRFEGNIMQQFYWIFQNPIEYIVIILKTINGEKMGYFQNLIGIGRSLSYYSVSVTSFLSWLIVITIFGVFISDAGLDSKFIKVRSLYILLTASCCLIIFTALYVWWTPYGLQAVSGVQGRYFIPLLLGLVLVINGKWNPFQCEDRCRMLTCILGLLDVSVLLGIFLQTLN